jgi:formate hydrogenlyase subunit 4
MGRRGPPLLQPYWDVLKCPRRGAVFGDVASWVFKLEPVLNLSGAVRRRSDDAARLSGDLIVVAGLFAVGRFVTVLARVGGAFSLTSIYDAITPSVWLATLRPWRWFRLPCCPDPRREQPDAGRRPDHVP